MSYPFPFDAMQVPFEPLFSTRLNRELTAILFLIKDGDFLLRDEDEFPTSDALKNQGIHILSPLLLIGRYADQTPIYTAELSSYTGANFCLKSAREIFALSPQHVIVAMMRAMQLLHFIKEYRFCGRCGTENTLKNDEPCMVCRSCGNLQYPVISPAILALVEREDHILLAHNIRFPTGLYSLVAGFCESGELAEDTVIREVFEETGLIVKNVEFMASQNWPYPHSLMLGFRAQWDSGDICCDKVEIIDAQWFSIHDLPTLPNPDSLARKMINIWALEQGVLLEPKFKQPNDKL